MNLFQDLSALLFALKAQPRSMKSIWKAFLKVLNDLDTFIADDGTPTMFGAKEVEDCEKLCHKIAAECNKVSDPVGRDGKWLKIIAEIIIKFLPLFIEPAPQS